MSTKVEISKRLVLINSASSVVERMVSISVLVWLHQHLLRRISPEEYSILPVVMAVMVFVPLLTVILTSGLSRYIVEAYAKGDERRVTQIVSTMFPLLLGAGVALLALGWTFAWYVDRVLTIAPGRVWDARIMMALLMFSAAVRVPLSVFGVGLYVRQKFVLTNCIKLCAAFFRIALLFILLLGISTRVLWMVVASVSAELCGLLVTVTISRRLVPALKFRPSEIRWPLAKELTKFGTWRFIGQVAYTIRSAVDLIILNKFATPVDVTCFHLGSFPDRHIRQTTIAIAAPLQPVLTAMHSTGRKEGLKNAYLRGGRYSLWAALLVGIPFIIYRHDLLGLYLGSKYATFVSAATVMMLLLLIHPVVYTSTMLGKIAHARGEIRSLMLRSLLMDITNLILTLYLVGVLEWGAIGAALATFSVRMVCWPLLLWPLGLRLANVTCGRWCRETILRGLVPGIVGTMVWLGMKMIVSPSSWVSLGACVAVGVVCYVLVVFQFCLDSYDRNQMRQVVAGLLHELDALRGSPEIVGEGLGEGK